MKLRYLFAAAVAVLALVLNACTPPGLPTPISPGQSLKVQEQGDLTDWPDQANDGINQCTPAWASDAFSWSSFDSPYKSGGYHPDWLYNEEPEIVNEARVWHVAPPASSYAAVMVHVLDDGTCRMYDMDVDEIDPTHPGTVAAKAWRHTGNDKINIFIVADSATLQLQHS